MSATRPTPAAPRPSTGARQRILAAATTLFASQGYDGVSIRDVAQRAEASKANVFHHFINKAGLYSAVLEESASSFQVILDSFDACDGGPQERIGTVIRQNLDTMLANPASVNLFLRQLLTTPGNSQRNQAESLIARDLGNLLARVREQTADTAGDEGNTAAHPLALTLCILGANLMYFQLRDVLPRLGHKDAAADREAFCEALLAILTPSLNRR